jgi:hypothetical protein
VPGEKAQQSDHAQVQFMQQMKVRIAKETSTTKEIMTSLANNLAWMLEQHWQFKFIELFMDISLKMEVSKIFDTLTDTVSNKWFLIPHAQASCGRIPPEELTTLGLREGAQQDALEKCEEKYRAFLAELIWEKLTCMHGHSNGSRSGNTVLDPFFAAIDGMIYSSVPKPDRKDSLDEFLSSNTILPGRVSDCLAAKYAFAQGEMRHIKNFPERSGEEVCVFGRSWPRKEMPSFLLEKYGPSLYICVAFCA